MKLSKVWNWLANNNGAVIKRTAIAAGSVIGLALLSGVTVDKDEDTDGFETIDDGGDDVENTEDENITRIVTDGEIITVERTE